MKTIFKPFAALFVLVALISPTAYPQSYMEQNEQALFQAANRERVSRGLAPLKWSDALAQAARQHALLLARQNTLSHQLPGEPALQARVARTGAHFSMIAENVAEGPSADEIHTQWMNSAAHRDNLLDPHLDSVGIAVADRNGTLFAVQDFSMDTGGLTLGEQEAMVNAQLRMRGLRLLNNLEDARKSCVLNNGYAGSHEPDFVIHYATADLQTLPEILESRIQTGNYHSAVAGACLADGKLGFSSYRVAVLLYQ